jgi:hypothetical protein
MGADTNKPAAIPTDGWDGDESTYTFSKRAAFDHPPNTITYGQGKAGAHHDSGVAPPDSSGPERTHAAETRRCTPTPVPHDDPGHRQ